MSEQSEAPKKIWLEYTPDEQHLHLTDELVWTGYLTEYVKADYYGRLVEALRNALSAMEYDLERIEGEWGMGADLESLEKTGGLTDEIIEARALLAALEAEKGGEL